MSSRDLGGGWVEATDRRTGRKYYANRKTKETRWTLPEELTTSVSDGGDGRSAAAAAETGAAASEATAVDAAQPAEAGGDVWVEKRDKTSGKKFYYNKTRRKSAWKPPPGEVVETREGGSTRGGGEDSSASNRWHPKTDKRTGRTYFYNKATRKTVWKLPANAIVVERGRREASGREGQDRQREGADGGQDSAASGPSPHRDAQQAAASTLPSSGERGATPGDAGAASSGSAVATVSPAGAHVSGNGAAPAGKEPAQAVDCAQPEASNRRASLTRIASRRSSMTTVNKIAASRRSVTSARRRSTAPALSPLLERSTDASGVSVTNPSVVAEQRRASQRLSGEAVDAAARATAEVLGNGSGAAGEASATSGTGVNAMAGPRTGGALWRAGISKASEKTGDPRFKGLMELAKNPGRMQAVREDLVKKESDDGKLHFRKCKYSDFVDMSTKGAVPHRDFAEYAAAHFELNRKGLLRSRTSVARVVAYKKGVIRMALSKGLSSEVSALAVQCFRWISKYMGDRPSTKDSTTNLYKLVKHVVRAPVELADEVYSQLIKQTTENPELASLERGWRLFVVITGSSPCSDTLLPFLRSHLYRHVRSSDIGRYAHQALARIDRIMGHGQEHATRMRKDVPCAAELHAGERMHSVIVRIYFLDGSHIFLPVDPWTTFRDLCDMVRQKLGMQDISPFAIYDVNDEDEHVMLMGERVLDAVSYWGREFQQGGESSKISRFVFRVNLFFDVHDEDYMAVRLMFMQGVHDVVNAHYPSSEEDAIVLAALYMQHEHGNFATEEEATKVLEAQLANYLPLRLLSGVADEAVTAKRSSMIHQVIEQYKKYEDYMPRDCELAYLDVIRAWDWYGSTFFGAEFHSGETYEDVILAVNPRGVMVVDEATKDIIQKFPFEGVPSWGFTEEEFVLNVGSNDKSKAFAFTTDEGKEINAIVRAYVDRILDMAKKKGG